MIGTGAGILGGALRSRQLVSIKIHIKYELNAAVFLKEFDFLSYLLYGEWLPAFTFSHTILFLVGLWALVDKESLEAVVSVSLH